MKSNWLLSELQQALKPEAITDLETWHASKVKERERARAVKQATGKITIATIERALGPDAAARVLEEVQQAAETAATTVEPGAAPVVVSSAESVASSPKKPTRK